MAAPFAEKKELSMMWGSAFGPTLAITSVKVAHRRDSAKARQDFTIFLPLLTDSSSVGGNSEINGNAGLGLNRLAGLKVGFEAPLLHCFPCCCRENGGSAEHL